MSDPQLDRIRAAAHEILAALDGGGPDPGPLRPPSGFTAVWEPDTRTVLCRWSPSADVVEVHERDTDPSTTLKAILGPGATERRSSKLRGGHTYTWAVRAVRDGQPSAFSEWITLDVPAEGEEPDEDDEQDDGGEQPGGPYPSDVLDLRHWTVALDVGNEHDPDNDYRVGETIPGKFFVRDDRGVVFRARAGGVTTKNSKYPRVEAREMIDDDWNEAARPSSVPASLEIDLALDARGLPKRSRLVGAQIHGTGDDVCQIMRHEEWGLVLMHSDGNAFEIIDPDYVDGARVTCRIVVVPRPGKDKDLVRVYYAPGPVGDDWEWTDDDLKAEISARGSAWYFKFGAYLQSNPTKWGESPDATGDVVVYRYVLSVDGAILSAVG